MFKCVFFASLSVVCCWPNPVDKILMLQSAGTTDVSNLYSVFLTGTAVASSTKLAKHKSRWNVCLQERRQKLSFVCWKAFRSVQTWWREQEIKITTFIKQTMMCVSFVLLFMLKWLIMFIIYRFNNGKSFVQNKLDCSDGWRKKQYYRLVRLLSVEMHILCHWSSPPRI